MPIILSQTFEVVTEESAQDGDAAERGYDWEDVPHTFKEVVSLINDGGFIHPSCSPGVSGWLTSEAVQDIHDGSYETKSLHPGSDAQSQRYWVKACRAAGVLKDPIHWRGLITDAHYRGLRALVTYRAPDGYVLKGLALDNPTKGIGPSGVWFVCVDNFTNCVHLDNVLSVKQMVE